MTYHLRNTTVAGHLANARTGEFISHSTSIIGSISEKAFHTPEVVACPLGGLWLSIYATMPYIPEDLSFHLSIDKTQKPVEM